MGQKVNPIGLRLILNKKWQSRWYAGKKEFGLFLQEDLKIRALIFKSSCKNNPNSFFPAYHLDCHFLLRINLSPIGFTF